MKRLTALFLTLFATATFAVPQYLIINNTTNVESNAYIANAYPSSMPSKPKAVNRVPWFVVQMACYRHTEGRQCPATIKMETNTSNPVDLAYVQLNLDTGAITVLSVVNPKYVLTVNGLAQVTLSDAQH